MSSLSPLLVPLSARCMPFSTVSRSASANSVLMVSMSASGLMRPETCTMFSSSKQRTTWAMSSPSRMWARNLFPNPSPLEAPATRPAMSTNSIVVGRIFSGLAISASCCRRGSGTSTIPHLKPILKSRLLVVCVQTVHDLLELAMHDVRDMGLGAGDGRIDQRLLRRRRLFQNVRHDLRGVAGMSYADTQTRVVGIVELFGNIDQPVMAAVAAADFQPHGSRRQVQFIVHHENFRGRDFVIVGESGDRVTAVIHEGLRLKQPDVLAAHGQLADIRRKARFVVQFLAGRIQQDVQKTEPGIVPGFRILRARGPQANDERDALGHPPFFPSSQAK